MEQYTYPSLRKGERLIEVAQLVLIYDGGKNLIYMRCQNGQRFTVGKGAYSLLELLAYRPGQIHSYEKILQYIYDTKRRQRPKENYVSQNVGAIRLLRSAFKTTLNISPMVIHNKIGISLTP